MKQYFMICFLIASYTLNSQNTPYNSKKGYVAEGYDVVAYFSDSAIKGKKEFTTEFNGAKFKFSSQDNLNAFITNPEKYTPQYGGYCAYAMGVKAKKVSINPETFEVRDGKLYLFYNRGNTNTLQLWLDEGAIKLQQKADNNWRKFINR